MRETSSENRSIEVGTLEEGERFGIARKDLLSQRQAIVLDLLNTRRGMYIAGLVQAYPQWIKTGYIRETVKCMERRGYVYSEQAESRHGGSHRRYQITDQGIQVLRAWSEKHRGLGLGVVGDRTVMYRGDTAVVMGRAEAFSETRVFILQALAKQRMYSMQLVRVYPTRVKPVVIRGCLQRMEGRGLVASEQMTSKKGGQHKQYRITEHGRELLHSWEED